MAAELGIKATRLSSYEHAAVPVPYSIASKFANITGMNIAWLVEGQGDPHDQIEIGPEIEARIATRALLSDAYDRHIKPALNAFGQEEPTNFEKYVARAKDLGYSVKPIRSIGLLSKDAVASQVSKVVAAYLNKLPPHMYQPLATRIQSTARDFVAKNTGGAKAQNKTLTNCSTSNIDTDVTDRWAKLKKQLQEATARKGMKTRLAKHLGVDLTRISQWLAPSDDAREPGADYTLQMLAWLNDLKHQQK